MTSTPTPVPAAEPTHGCVRCGARIPIEESMCEACNPLGLKAPAASQAHGTVFLGILVAVVIMAVVARMLIADVGPFTSSVTAVASDPVGLKLSIAVSNAGAAAGTTTCRIDDPALRGIGPEAVFIESPKVPAHGSISFDVVVQGFGTTPKPMTADCGS
jgi:predicted nucleic acid-binding Zn ribbon protein